MASAVNVNLVVESKPFVEQCWTLVGRRRGRLWQTWRQSPTVGKIDRVSLDAPWVLAREEALGDVGGFYHTHPSGSLWPSKRDDRTMHGWVGSFGKPLLCLIEADLQVVPYLYEDDTSAARRLAACQPMTGGIVLVYEGDGND
jgi:hypothetical protein